MKSRDEIQCAHDILHAVFLDEIDIGQDDAIREHALITCSALCWALGCDAGEAVERNLRFIHRECQERGYQLLKAPEPTTREEWEAARRPSPPPAPMTCTCRKPSYETDAGCPVHRPETKRAND